MFHVQNAVWEMQNLKWYFDFLTDCCVQQYKFNIVKDKVCQTIKEMILLASLQDIFFSINEECFKKESGLYKTTEPWARMGWDLSESLKKSEVSFTSDYVKKTWWSFGVRHLGTQKGEGYGDFFAVFQPQGLRHISTLSTH